MHTRSHRSEPSQSQFRGTSGVSQSDECQGQDRISLLAQKEPEAVRRHKLELLGQSYTALTHQIRTPLTVAGLYAELLEPQCESDAASKKALNGIVASLHTIESYMRNCMIFVKGELQERRIFSVSELVEGVEDSCQRYFRAGEYQLIQPEVCVGSISGDLSALLSAIDNLLENATQAIDDRPMLSVHIARDRNCLVLALSDNGPGIPTELQQSVKQPFVSGRKEGTGLGLAIAESVVRAHHGDLSISANTGAGTTARIRLPLLPSDTAGNE